MSLFSPYKSSKVTKEREETLVDGPIQLVDGVPASSIYDYYRAMGYKDGGKYQSGMANVSSLKLGDERVLYQSTVQHDSMIMVLEEAKRLKGAPPPPPPVYKEPEEYDRIYRAAMRTVGPELVGVSAGGAGGVVPPLDAPRVSFEGKAGVPHPKPARTPSRMAPL